MKKNKSIYVVIILINIIVVIGLLVYVNGDKNKNNSYIILPGDDIYLVQNNSLESVNYEIEKPLQIMFKSEQEKKLTFTYKNKHILFYENNEPIIIPDDFKIAYSNNSNIKFINYEFEDVDSTNLKKFDDIMKKHDIIGYDYLTTSKKLSFDFDDDGKLEEIYFVSNLFEELSYDKVFSFVYYIENDEIVYLQEDVTSSDNAYDICYSDINSIIDMNEKDLMIITCTYFSEKGMENKIYNYEKGRFSQIDK